MTIGAFSPTTLYLLLCFILLIDVFNFSDNNITIFDIGDGNL